jgi:hypothetical protein
MFAFPDVSVFVFVFVYAFVCLPRIGHDRSIMGITVVTGQLSAHERAVGRMGQMNNANDVRKQRGKNRASGGQLHPFLWARVAVVVVVNVGSRYLDDTA